MFWNGISKTGYGAVKCDLHEKYGLMHSYYMIIQCYRL